MELVKKGKRGNDVLYFVNSIDENDIRDIIHAIEEDGYIINEISVKFYYDHATVVPPKKYYNSADLLDHLQELTNQEEDIEFISYNAEKENSVKQGYISMSSKVISCTQFTREKKIEDKGEER